MVTEIDLKALIKTVIPSFESLIREKGLSLSLNIDETLPPVYGDEGKIKQILINLLSNAVKFTHTGGIIITAHPSDADRTHGVQPLFMEICLADTGIGIREDDLRKIFEKFMQIDFTLVRQYKGTGLGLSIAKGMVELHKGKIWATSKYGEGTTFCFTLPLQKAILVNTVVPL